MLFDISDLNKQQQEAVNIIDTPLLIIAGAGSGKTKVISSKIAHLIFNCHYEPKYITAITFTNKAASEMLHRTKALITKIKLPDNNVSKLNNLTITTFHSLGLKIIKQEHETLGYKKQFSILDSNDAANIIADIIKTNDKSIIKKFQGQFSLWKNNFIKLETIFDIVNTAEEIQIAQAFVQYEKTIKAYQTLDFDDLIKLPVELFINNPEILYKWQQKIRYLLVDEYQDTNLAQYQLIKLLTKKSNAITMVGDDDQSIYAWRGANRDNLINLQQDFTNLTVIKLEQNYRSTNTILMAANTLIKNNNKLFEKKLWSSLAYGEPIKILYYNNDELEAENIVKKILLHKLQYQTKFSDYAILYRSNHQARLLEQNLKQSNIPYTISGGSSFFEKTEIKDLVAYMRLIINEDDDLAFIRALTTPKRGIGDVTISKLATYAKNRQISLFSASFEEGFINTINDNQLEELQNFVNFINDLQFKSTKYPILELLELLIKSINYESYLYQTESNSNTAKKRMDNIMNFINWLDKKSSEQEKNLTELVQNIALINILSNEEHTEELDSVKLSTFHASKGLEYKYVFLISCEEGIIPHTESINNNHIEEERRLLYVGITRAKFELSISYCTHRKLAGELTTKERSRFIAEMGHENIIDMHVEHTKKITNNDELQTKLKQLTKLLIND